MKKDILKHRDNNVTIIIRAYGPPATNIVLIKNYDDHAAPEVMILSRSMVEAIIDSCIDYYCGEEE